MNFYTSAVKILREMVDAVNGIFKDWELPKSIGSVSKCAVISFVHRSGIADDLHPRPPPTSIISISAWKGDEILCRNK